jgi:membrane protein required for colicin V production
MSVIDIVLGALLIFGLIRGFMKGLFVEVASLVALVAGVYGAIHFSHYMSEKLGDNVNWDEKYVNVLAFAVTFFLIVLLVSLAGKAFTKLADFAALGILNKLLGAAFGVLKIGFILSIVLIIFSHTNNNIEFVSHKKLTQSVLYLPVKNIATLIFPNIIKQEEEFREDLIGK